MAADSNQVSPRSGRSGAPGGDSSRLDESELQQDYVGFKEGKNELGQVWKEDWQKNIKKNYYRWNHWTEEKTNSHNNKWG